MTLTTDGLAKTITLRAKRSRVWRALTTPQEFGAWFGVAMDADYPLGLKGGLKGISKAPPPPPSTRKGLPSKPSAPPNTGSHVAQKTLHPPPTPPGKVAAKANLADEAPASGRVLAAVASKFEPKLGRAHESTQPRTAKAGAPRVFARAAVKVYVPANAQAGDKLEVYVLREGQHAPPGAVEAMLVPIQRGTKLFE